MEEKKIKHELVSMIEDSNLKRTRYLLQHYTEYAAQMPTGLDSQISRAVLQILTLSLRERKKLTQEDYELVDHCGPFLVPAVEFIAKTIKNFPPEVASKIYPVLYHQYFSEEGMAIDIQQLTMRLQKNDDARNVAEVRIALEQGERIMSALLFQDPFLMAMNACT